MFALKVLIFLAALKGTCLALDAGYDKRAPGHEPWSAWSECSKTCGGGVRSRHKPCHRETCETEEQACETQHCPIPPHWSEWSSCSATCGNGESVRHLICSTETTLVGKRSTCTEQLERQTCSSGLCPTDGHWGSWSDWSKCPETCVTQPQIRIRACNNPAPDNGGRECEGLPYENQDCPCPVDGNWGGWSEMSRCSVSCGTGMQVRIRSCSNPAPSNGGLPCVGTPMDSLNCSLPDCEHPHVCDIVRLLTSIFHNNSVSGNGDTSCQNSSHHSSRVLIQELCKAPSTSLRIGSKVLDVCSQILAYSPVVRKDDITGHNEYGILIECHVNKLKVAIQDCNHTLHIVSLDETESNMYHVVTW